MGKVPKRTEKKQHGKYSLKSILNHYKHNYLVSYLYMSLHETQGKALDAEDSVQECPARFETGLPGLSPNLEPHF